MPGFHRLHHLSQTFFSALLGGSLPHFRVQGPHFAPEGVVQLEKLIAGKCSLYFTNLRSQQAMCNLVSNASSKCFNPGQIYLK